MFFRKMYGSEYVIFQVVSDDCLVQCSTVKDLFISHIDIQVYVKYDVVLIGPTCVDAVLADCSAAVIKLTKHTDEIITIKA